MQRPLPYALPAVLSAAGFGLLLWLGVSVALLPPGSAMAVLRAPQMWALILAVALIVGGGALVYARATPPRDPRRFLLAPTRWHGRRNVLVGVALLLAFGTAVLLTPGLDGATRALGLGFVGMLLALTSLGSLAAGALVEVSSDSALAPPPLAVPARMLSAMLTGLALMFALQSGMLGVGPGGSRMLVILLVLGLLAATLHALDVRAAPGVRVRPSWRAMLLPALLFAGVPALALGLAATGVGAATLWLWIVAGASMGGAFAARNAHAAVSDVQVG